ncbi:TatD family hydrolase [Guyparkeria hydrothermalis]|uniref:TatD family hydrolase n=1 Tax=Guyparkeria hydrothermalis TaxID=923 RepID=UPI002021D29E|nr:TatD family hydrolase [Guyparkeria hydrothermalis]MCL7751562.1 TatD family hydrolase [Guyparkeria hydrothermalis]
MQLFDSHCHLDRVELDAFDNDFDRFMHTAWLESVTRMLCVSIKPSTWPAMTDLVSPYLAGNPERLAERPEVFLSYGLHPTDDAGAVIPADELVRAIRDDRHADSIVAVGETGLDYFHCEEGERWQHDRFVNHIEAAKAVGKPVIIHTRGAPGDTMDVLEREHAEECGGVMHCFAEDWETARRALDLGFYISFSGIVTFKSAAALREVAKKVPGDRILIETDSPYLSPVPYRGKPNNPIRVRHVAEMLADLRGESLPEMATRSRENAQRWLGLATG